jgi:hypothetical protein
VVLTLAGACFESFRIVVFFCEPSIRRTHSREIGQTEKKARNEERAKLVSAFVVEIASELSCVAHGDRHSYALGFTGTRCHICIRCHRHMSTSTT